MKRNAIRLLVVVVVVSLVPGMAAVARADYHPPMLLLDAFHDLARKSGDVTLHDLGNTPGGVPLALLEIGKRGDDAPGILVVANMAGDAPLASEAALELAQRLAGEWAGYTEDVTWYIYACGNPDGYASFFAPVRMERFTNAKPVNNDADRLVDEDIADDINGDGVITMIRQPHPEGTFAAVADKPYLKPADPTEGQGGRYRLFPEGIDNDLDGSINEDLVGGVNPNHNFPHNWPMHTDDAGLWAASETETRELLRFAYDHTNIAMVLVFGRSNTLRQVPESDRKADLLNESFAVPGWLARRAGLKRGSSMKLGEMLTITRDALSRPGVTVDQLLGWISTGAETDPHPKDLAYWNVIADRYTAFLDSSGANGDRLDSPPPEDGSVEQWAYYQYGTPTFALDFWTLPTPAPADEDSVVADTDTDPGYADPELDALLAYDPSAWIAWKPFDHATLGRVEIGGVRPYATLAPKPDEVEGLIDTQLPFVLELSDLLPRVVIDSVAVTERAAGVYELDAWITNTGFLPYPTWHGQRTQRPSPVTLTLEGVEADAFLEGRPRHVCDLLEGNGGSERARWVVTARPGSEVTLTLWSSSAGGEQRRVTLKGGRR